MNVLLFCLFLLVPSYLQLWLFWAAAKASKAPISDTKTPISVVIPFRNEADNLESLLACLKQLVIIPNDEVILVNDQSDDGGENFLQNLPDFVKCLTIPEGTISSKKEALKLGIDAAKNQWILTSDADCVFMPSWLNSWRSELDQTSDLICGPVKLKTSGVSLLNSIAGPEHLALQIITKSAILHNVAMLGNGANLMYRKASWMDVGGYASHAHLASGDDVLLMRDMKKASKSIAYASSVNCAVTTNAASTFGAWLNQHLRWMSKSSHLAGMNAKLHAILLLIWMVTFLPALYYYQLPYLLVLIPELVILRVCSPFRVDVFNYIVWPVFRLVYPCIVLILFILNFFYHPRWKGRAVHAEA